MAKAAAAYIHPRLSSVAANVEGTLTLQDILMRAHELRGGNAKGG